MVEVITREEFNRFLQSLNKRLHELEERIKRLEQRKRGELRPRWRAKDDVLKRWFGE